MKWRQLLIALVLSVALISPATITPASATAVSLELMIMVDVSGSVDYYEYGLQKGGIVAAFNDASIQAAIAALPLGMAVAYAEWDGAANQAMVVGWTQVTDATTASAFASAINAASRAFLGGGTAPGTAINWGASSLASNSFTGARLVIDISGDGSQNEGANTFAAATAAYAAGITINGLPILTDEATLDDWYQDNIVTPGHGFMIVANDFNDFEDAFKAKIGQEIVPIPPTLLLLGAGLLGLVGLRRRQR